MRAPSEPRGRCCLMETLCNDIWVTLLSKLQPPDVFSLFPVCKIWQKVFQNEEIWSLLLKTKFKLWRDERVAGSSFWESWKKFGAGTHYPTQEMLQPGRSFSVAFLIYVDERVPTQRKMSDPWKLIFPFHSQKIPREPFKVSMVQFVVEDTPPPKNIVFQVDSTEQIYLRANEDSFLWCSTEGGDTEEPECTYTESFHVLEPFKWNHVLFTRNTNKGTEPQTINPKIPRVSNLFQWKTCQRYRAFST